MRSTDALRADGTLSSLRTHRYVRVSLCAAVLLLGVAVLWHIFTVGPLRSISAAYYTPVRSVFVGALFAVAVGLVVLAGRSLRRYLLLLGGMTAPLIALVPVPLRSDELVRLTGAGCPEGVVRCLPPGATDEIAAGMLAYLVVAGAVLVASTVFLALDRALDRGALVKVAIAAALLAALAVSSATPAFGAVAHYGAAAVFFLLMAAVAGVHAYAVRSEGVRGPGTSRGYSIAYGLLAALLAATDLALVALVASGSGEALLGEQWLLLVEAAALALFTAFWVLQTVENWDDPDPSLR